jgi:6-pyruvoyltetrahydropterin/6-carboxytetrahydropterin synthase
VSRTFTGLKEEHMTLTLYTEACFNAAHILKHYKGKCSRLHGHTWKISVWVKGDEEMIKPNGILWDFTTIKEIAGSLDHTLLNDVIDGDPTAESIAIFVYRKLKKDDPALLFKVRIYEKIHPTESFCETGDFE